ncbi:hypothetical protein FACUT_2569 [Fusarium acutatum]|uniref:Uncharacterized protein n=1 Tax=Fusarium acutatum TaxID=78861 RepID=A0A8H4K0Z3_9HYPO|nr:hypothetical protein FACUT_2569 [Fusarium acutatum]
MSGFSISMLPNAVGSGNKADVNSPKFGMSGISAGLGAVAEEPSPCVVSLMGKSFRAVWNGVTGKGLGADSARQFEMIRFIAFHIGVASRPVASMVFFNESKARDRSTCRLGASKLGMLSSETIWIITDSQYCFSVRSQNIDQHCHLTTVIVRLEMDNYLIHYAPDFLK